MNPNEKAMDMIKDKQIKQQEVELPPNNDSERELNDKRAFRDFIKTKTASNLMSGDGKSTWSKPKII